MLLHEPLPFNYEYVQWEDALGDTTWQIEDEIEVKFSIVHSYGYIVNENKKGLVIAPSYFVDDEGKRHWGSKDIIPKRAIKKRKVLVPKCSQT